MTKRDKYRVVRKIDAGGMAEVFQGVAESIEGFKKKVAIKRVLPHLAENKKFLAMFLDEARVSMHMNHANVVHVFDIGQAGGTYFIVMEFVDGTDLKKVMEVVRVRKTRLPIAQAIYIVMEICKGLGYAHDLVDADGVNLGIVHRDVSPPNVLMSKQGEVKIVDFGLAKATSQLEHTDPGVVKGKFAYLAPEAAWGERVDTRADIFACGIILFELLTARRLFLGENDVQTVELVRRAEVPPIKEYNPDVLPDLEKIALKALAADPDARYRSCEEMAEDLAGYLFAQRLKVTGFDLGRMVKEIASSDEEEDDDRPSIIDQLIQEELAGFASLDETASKLDRSPGERARAGTTGGQPLNPFGFEDPRDWDSELQVKGSDSPLPVGGQGEWRESGLYRRDSSIEEEQPRSSNLADSLEGPMSLARMLEGEARMSSEVPSPSTGGMKSVIIGLVVTVVLIAAAASVAFALGWLS